MTCSFLDFLEAAFHSPSVSFIKSFLCMLLFQRSKRKATSAERDWRKKQDFPVGEAKVLVIDTDHVIRTTEKKEQTQREKTLFFSHLACDGGERWLRRRRDRINQTSMDE